MKESKTKSRDAQKKRSGHEVRGVSSGAGRENGGKDLYKIDAHAKRGARFSERVRATFFVNI